MKQTKNLVNNIYFNKKTLKTQNYRAEKVVLYPTCTHTYPQFCQKTSILSSLRHPKSFLSKRQLVCKQKAPFQGLFALAVRLPGLGPDSPPWQGGVLPLNHNRELKRLIFRQREPF